jgi:hypothetical protein
MHTLKAGRVRTLLCLAAVFTPAGLFAQGKVSGVVSNGTVNRPVPNQEIRLLMPRGGMQQVGTATTDAEGRFSFTGADLDPKSFYLVSTDFQGAPYNTPATFDSSGTATVNLTVYDSMRSDASLRVSAVRVLVGAEGPGLRVQEEYAIQNSASPPRAYVGSGSTFRFHIPADAGTPSVAVTGLMNMQLPQTPAPGRGPGEFSIGYPIKPGATTVTIQYSMPYDASGVKLKDGASYPIDQAELYVYPSSLAIAAPGFQPAGIDNPHKIQKYEARQLASGTSSLSIQLSGESASGPPPGAEQQGQAQSNDQGQGEVKIVPNSVSQLNGPVLAGFVLLLFWALGVRLAKDWPKLQAAGANGPAGRRYDPKLEKLLNSITDLDELFAAGKMAEQKYWKERLELKARVAAILKKSPPAAMESYAARHNPR